MYRSYSNKPKNECCFFTILYNNSYNQPPPSLKFQAPGAPRYYTALGSYNPGSDEHGVALAEDQEVEVLGINQFGWWWVRSTNHSSGEVEEGWVPASYLRVSAVAVSDV